MVDEKSSGEKKVEVVTCYESGKIVQSPCHIRCPLEEDIQRTHAMISMLPDGEEAVKEAMMRIGHDIYKKNPLFTILCGNICGLCEEECNYNEETGSIRRRKIIQPIANLYNEYLKTSPCFPEPKKEKIAIVGGGPSGLMCAYTLSGKGYRVTIFERNSKIGGALRYIPKFRLPTKILDSLLNSIVRIAHITLETDVEIGPSGISIKELKKKGFKAIYMATGTPNPRILSIDSETPEFKEIIQRLVDGDETQGISFGLDILYKVDRGDVPLDFYKGKKVIVVGGGNVAFDVARTARRLGPLFYTFHRKIKI